MWFRYSFVAILALMLPTMGVNGANILYLSSVTSPSHHIWNSAFINGLAAHGHNITVLSPDKDKNAPTGVHYIVMEGLYNDAYHQIVNSMMTQKHEVNPLTAPYYFDEFWYAICEGAIQTKGFQTLLDYSDDFQFDLVIYDFIGGPCLLGFLHKFNSPPLLSVTAYGNPSNINALIGGHQYYSYIPHYFLNYKGDMNLFQRMYNFVVHIAELLFHKQIHNRKVDKLVEDKFGPGLPTMTELEQRTAIAFVSSNPTIDHMAPLPENVIPVAGLHIRDTKPLPQDLEDYIMSTKKGAVLFSLGSNVRSSAMTKEKQKIILDAFEQFPDYNFLWKFEEPSIDLKLPKNVIIRPWLPQSDILAHPKLRAFFTHSGGLSSHEIIWRGVPILGMPFGYDQDGNLLKAMRNGYAERVDFYTLTTEIIKEKLGKILEDPKYYANAKKVSARFRDQKEKALDRAVWYTEWLLRNPDCEYLKSPVLRLGFIVGNSYDLIAIISITLFIIVVLIVRTCSLKLFKVTKKTRNSDSDQKKVQ